ncbi:hypothetical protein DSO57_1030377 [Entomophthora muscae]|uniref:Uncharacterized protein n=1 Tax=Entomophthora muscae TaxID=34485 RepID=A0ACC2UAD1_9FUNG|nr:hypothetical protein DSO57_1030377 [Entomophthora muscae]
MANCEIEALRAREGKSVEIMARWRDNNKVLSNKIASLEAKLLKALSQEGNSNKSQGQDNGRMDWLGLDPSHTPSPEPEETSPTLPHSPFVYSLSDPQEKLFSFNRHSDPTSEPEDEEEQEPEPGASADDPIELWDLNSIHNVCYRNGTFAVPATYPVSYPIMTKKGGAGFVHKGYSFSCNNKKKLIHQHHYKCDNVGFPARLTTYGFTQFKALTIGHNFAKPFDPLYQLICWFLCQVIPTTKDQTSIEVVNNVLINLNDTQLATVGGASKL